MSTAAHNPHELPPDLPVPVDDGAALHLRGTALPDLALIASGTWRNGALTASQPLNLRRDLSGPCVLFFYPRTGVPGQPPSRGYDGEAWESIPGARGCTPQSCGFRDQFARFERLGVRVLGLSTSTSEHQHEFVQRNHVPFDMLSDSDLALTRALRLPTFRFPVESGGPDTLIRRMAWFIEPDRSGVPRIRKVWYPVFPPDRCAHEVAQWLEARARVSVVEAGAAHRAYIAGELRRHWQSTNIWSLGRMFRADTLPALVALREGEPVGHVTLHVEDGGYQCEVVTISTSLENAGVGERLLDAAVDRARAAGCCRVFLTTTNDNLRALGFYQKRGWRISLVRCGLVDQARAHKAVIPLLGLNGIPVRDEIELEHPLND